MRRAPPELPVRRDPPSCVRGPCVRHVHQDSVQAQTSLEMRLWMNKRSKETLRRCAVHRVSSQVENNIAAFPLELRQGKRTWTTSTWRTSKEKNPPPARWLREHCSGLSRRQDKAQRKPEMQHDRLHGTCRNGSGQGTNESLHQKWSWRNRRTQPLKPTPLRTWTVRRQQRRVRRLHLRMCRCVAHGTCRQNPPPVTFGPLCARPIL